MFNDPYTCKARFNSICTGCGKQIKKGQTIYVWPKRKAFCSCGEGEYRRFLSAVADENVYNGTGNPFA